MVYYYTIRGNSIPMARRVLVAEVSCGRVRGRPRLICMDGGRCALAIEECVEAARKSGAP